MVKYFKRIAICGLFAVLLWIINVYSNKENLLQEVIRFPVVENFKGSQDEQLIHQVRQTVLQSVQEDLEAISDTTAARNYLSLNLSKVQDALNNTQSIIGYPEWSNNIICKELFDVLRYETYTLPSSIYDSLHIGLGMDRPANG